MGFLARVRWFMRIEKISRAMAIEQKRACLMSGLPLTRPAARVGLSPKGEAKPGLRHGAQEICWKRIMHTFNMTAFIFYAEVLCEKLFFLNRPQ
jgi:hypothetical protein